MTRPASPENQAYVVLGCKSWNRKAFDERLSALPGKWLYVGTPGDLSYARLQEVAPRYVFVLHWSWKIPANIHDTFECVCFHMTDVPFGRGGSPLQNLILRGITETQLTALRMMAEFDAGPVYLKMPLSLEGNAESIYLRANDLAVRMIEKLIFENPEPKPQEGPVVVFKRRRAEESEIKSPSSINALYNFVRMLDAEGYPRAFLNSQGFKYEFKDVVLSGNVIEGKVTISPVRKGENDL